MRLFSAYAEVFPLSTVSGRTESNFSLPTQRCFRVRAAKIPPHSLFSAYAEVFP